MAALVNLNPSLPQDVNKKYGVSINGYFEASCIMRFDGAPSAVRAARNEVDSILVQAIVTVLNPIFPHSLLPLAQKQLKTDSCKVYISFAESKMMSDVPVGPSHDQNVVTVCSFDEQNHKVAVTLLQTNPLEEEVIIPYAVMQKLCTDGQLKQLEDEFCIAVKQQTEHCQEAQNSTMVITGFHPPRVKMAQEKLNGLIKLHSEQRVKLDCKLEEMIYLCKVNREARSYLSSLPARVTVEDNEIELYGNQDHIDESKDKIFNGPLRGLYSKTFQFKCNAKFQSQIECYILKPLKTEHNLSFQYFVDNQSHIKCVKQSRNEDSSELNGFEIVVYSKDESVFNKVCSEMEVLNPKTQQFPLNYREATDCIRKLKQKVETKYHVRVIVHQGQCEIIVHGLIPDEIQQCWEDIKNSVKSTVEIKKHISVEKHECIYLEKKHSDSLRQNFSCDIAFPRQRESYSVRIRGKIKDVEAVESKVSDIIKTGIQVITFNTECKKSHFMMWKKWWLDLIRQEQEKHDVVIHFNKDVRDFSGDGSSTIQVLFEVIGTNLDILRDIQSSICSEETEERTIDVSDGGKSILMDVKMIPSLQGLAVSISINMCSSKIILVSPKALSNDLGLAEGEIRKYIGLHANVSKELNCQDPVVGLILTSPTMSTNYLKTARDITAPHKVAVYVSKVNHEVGMKLTGSPSAIQIVEPLIHSTLLKQAEMTVSQLQYPLPFTHNTLLTASEFSHLESKLREDYCVILSYPKLGLTSKAQYTKLIKSGLSTHCLRLDICHGNLVHERVDAIVNAANEDLKHIGGLAKGILDSGGATIQSESEEYVQSHGKVSIGTCVCLGAGNLPCKKIIHAVGPQWHGGGINEEEMLYNTVYRSLQCADENNLNSIALPAISTGIYDVLETVCARASLRAVHDYC